MSNEDLSRQATPAAPRMLLGLSAVAGLASAFMLLGRYATGDAPHAWDNGILLALRNPGDLSDPVGPPFVLEIMRDVTTLAGWPALTIVIAILCGYLALRGAWMTVMLLLAAVIGESLIVEGLKAHFMRERPSIVPHLVAAGNYSFPSGHATSAAAVYLTLGVIIARASAQRAVRIYCVAAAALMALATAFTRVYLGVHYPSDVLAGLSLGAAWAAIIWIVAYYLERTKGFGARK